MSMKQKGKNNKFPKEIETWRLGETIPEWLSDIAKVKFVDGSGNLTLDITETNTGGYEIKSSDGTRILVGCEDKEDYICIGLDKDNREIFSLNPIALGLLYG